MISASFDDFSIARKMLGIIDGYQDYEIYLKII